MYFPKSQIKPNLQTNGGEYILSTTKENYKGYYYEISTGEKYTGKFPKDGPNILLTNSNVISQQNQLPKIFPTELITPITFDSPEYSFVPSTRVIPSPNLPPPTQQDQQNGQFSRYFCKKTNENKYMEIDQDTYKKLTNKDPQMAWDLYNPIQVIWIIKGDKNQTYLSNKGSVTVIEQQINWYGFTQWFQDKFLKYYLEP
jgi:hypothetical protein